ncbi:hypothetical protein Btru_053443 [Bulinus truncatus]|nr:hypothetical protein Btru_053443 [Bulinus truncatus]
MVECTMGVVEIVIDIAPMENFSFNGGQINYRKLKILICFVISRWLPAEYLNETVVDSIISTVNSGRVFHVNQTVGSTSRDQDQVGMFQPPVHLLAICTILYVAIFILGLVGNIAVILVVLQYRSMRTSINLLFLNLCLADLFALIITGPTMVVDIFAKEVWYLGPFMFMSLYDELMWMYCQVMSLYDEMLMYCQVMSLYDELMWMYCQVMSLYDELMWMYCQVMSLYDELMWRYCQVMSLYDELMWMYCQVMSLYDELMWMYCQVMSLYDELMWM